MSETPLLHVSTPEIATGVAPRRIVLFGPPSLYRDALKCLLESRVSNARVVHFADQEALLAASDADLFVFDADVESAVDDRLERLALTLQQLAPRPVLLVSGGMEPPVLQRLLRAGVTGIVMRTSPIETLLEAIASVASGKVWLQRDVVADTFGDSSHSRRPCSEAHRIAQLTPREREIVAVAASGLTNRQVAQKVVISEPTVRHHLSSIFAKLGVSNRGELIVFAYRHGLADETERQRLC